MAEWNGEVAGFALYFFGFSTWTGGPILYLEDLFVRESHRKNGLGLLAHEAPGARSRNEGCPRMTCVLDWNTPSHPLLRSARREVLGEWETVRIDDALAKLASDWPRDAAGRDRIQAAGPPANRPPEFGPDPRLSEAPEDREVALVPRSSSLATPSRGRVPGPGGRAGGPAPEHGTRPRRPAHVCLTPQEPSAPSRSAVIVPVHDPALHHEPRARAPTRPSSDLHRRR